MTGIEWPLIIILKTLNGLLYGQQGMQLIKVFTKVYKILLFIASCVV